MKLVTNYLKNVTKSVAYVAADMKKDLAPNMTDFVDSNKDFIKATYATLKNPAITVRRSVSALQKSKVYQALDYGVRNTFEDLRTGNFYNKEREEKAMLEYSGLGDFLNFDDFSEFGIDDDWESKLEDEGSEKSEVTAGDIKIVNAIEGSNAAATSATINAIIASSEAQTKYSRANTGMIYIQNERLFGGLHKDLTALNETLVSLHKLTSTGLQNIDKNTADYFTAELKLSTERNAMLKEMLEMQRQYYKSAIDKDKEASKGSSSRMRWRDINIGGLPDFENYFKNVKKNVSEELNIYGISGFSDDSNMLATFMASPLQYALKGIMGGLIPAMVKDATKELDNTFSSIFANIIGKLGNRSDDYDLMGFISRFLGVNTRVNSNINTGKYEKGPVPFDGITRKAIIDVIPSYLRRIEAHISGNPEQTYDYNNGKWVNMKSVKEKFNDLHKDAVRQGTRDLSYAMDPKLKEIRNRFTDSDELDDFNEAVEEFYEYLYNNNGQFNPSKNARDNGISSSKYPHLSKQRNYNLIRGSYDIIGRGSVQYRGGTKSVHKVSTKMGVAKSVLDAKDSEERRYRELETSGTSTMSQLKSSLGVDMHGKWSGKSFTQDKGGLFVQDKLGNSVFDYLREINKELRWQRQTGFENIFGILRNMSGGNGSATQQGNGFTPIHLQQPGVILPNGAMHHISSASSAPNPNGYTLYSQTRRVLNDAAFNSIDLESQAHREARQNAEKAKQKYKDETKAKALRIISEGGGADLSQVDDNDVASYMLYLKRLFLEQNSEELKEQIEDENLGAASEFFEKHFFQTNVKSIKDVRRAAERAARQRQYQDQLDQNEKSFLSSLANKISKTGSLTGGIIGASGDLFTNLLYTADKAIYEMMFKSELRNTEDASIRYSGFMDMISHKINDTFDKIETFFKDNALDPIKKWLGIDDTFKDRFTDEAKRIGSGFWDRFANVNKEMYGSGVNQLLTDLGLKNRETTAQKKRRESRESAASAYDDLKNITNLYDPRFLEICREYNVNITEYDGNFDAAVAEVKKKVLQRFYKNTKRFKEVDNSDQVNKAILANQENLKELRSVAEEFGIALPEEDDDPAAVISAFTQGMSGIKSLVRGFDSTDSKKFRATNDAKLASKYLSDTQKAMISSTTRNTRNDIIRKTTTGIAASSVEKARALGFKDNDGERDKRVAMLKALNPNLSDEDINALDTDEKLADSYISQFTSALDTAKASGADVVSIAESLGFKGDRESKIKILKKLDPKISFWDLKNLDTDKKLAERFLKLQRKKYKRANAMRDEQAGGADAVAEAERLGFKGTREQKIAMLKQLNPDLKSSHINKLDSDEKLALNFLRLQRKNFATGTFGKPFMGDTMLSKGELLFNDDGISRVKKTDAYRLDKPTHILNSEDSFDLLEASGYPKNKLGVKSTIQQDLGREKLKEKALFGISKHASGTVQVSENGNASIDPKAILNEIKGAIPEGAAGGLIGLLAPALLGVSLGPIGAIVGASASVLHKSTALQETFFGKKDAAGKFDGSGLINGKIMEIVQKYAPTMLKYGLAGILPSMIIPGGGILRGLLLGAGAGFMKASDMSARNLFGDGSLLNTKNKNLLKKLGLGGLKGAAIGGALGLAGKMALGLSGPWGIVGATVLGSAIGMAKNTDEFKNSLFGTEDNSGIRHGGLLEEISEMFAPFREAMANLSDSIQKTVQQNIIKPLQEFLNPFIHGLPRLLTAPLRKFSSWMEKKFAKPMSQFLRTKILDPAKNLFAPVTKFIGKVGYGITAPIRGLGAIGNRMRKNQILDATADDMTAADRINFMNDKFADTRAKSAYDAGIGKFDSALRDLGTKDFTIKQGEQLRNDLYAAIDTNAGLTKARRKQEKEIGSALTKAFGGNISGKVINQAEKAIQDGHPEKVAGILKKAAISKKGGMTSEQFDDLMNGAVTKDGRSLNDMLKRRQTLQDRLNHFNSLTDEEKAQNQATLSEKFKKMGIDLDFSDRDQIRKYAKYLDTELEDRALNPDEEREALNEENAKNISQLAKDLHTILEKGIKIASGQDYEDMEPELNPDGSEKKDEHGNTIYKKVTKNEKNVVAQDEKGDIITDADGKPVYQTEAEKAIDKASQNTAKDMNREQADRADEVLRKAGLDPSKVSDSAKAHLGTAGTYDSLITNTPFIGNHFKGKVGNGENIDAKSLLSNGKKGVAITEGELNVSDGSIERIKEIKSLGADFVLKERKDIISYINGLTLERYNWLKKSLKKKHIKAWIAGNKLSLNDVKLLSDFSIDLKKLNNRCAQALRDNMPFYSLEQLYDADDLDRLHHEMKNPKPSQDQANTNTTEQTGSNTPEQDAAASVINDLTGNTEQVASAEPVEQTEDTTEEIPTHGLGTAILGGLGSLAGKAITGTISLASRGVTGLAKLAGKGVLGVASGIGRGISNGISSLTGGASVTGASGGAAAQEAVANATNNGSGMFNETDKPGDGRDVVQFNSEDPNSFGFVKRDSSGNVEPDTSDSRTKTIIKGMEKAKELKEKAQNAALKTASVIKDAFDVSDDPQAKKGKLNWWKLLIVGGLLWKSGILTKLFEGIVKPLWTNLIYPWWTETAWPGIKGLIFGNPEKGIKGFIPWLKEKWENPIKPWLLGIWDDHLKPWLTDTLLPWVTDTAIPGLVGIISDAIKSALGFGDSSSSSGKLRVMQDGVGTILDFGISGNRNNIGGKATTDYKDIQQGALHDVDGRTLTTEDIENGNYVKIYNADNIEGTVDPNTGKVTFKDSSRHGSNFVDATGNAAVHAFAQGSHGIGTGLMTGYGLVGKGLTRTPGGVFSIPAKLKGLSMRGTSSITGKVGKAGDRFGTWLYSHGDKAKQAMLANQDQLFINYPSSVQSGMNTDDLISRYGSVLSTPADKAKQAMLANQDQLFINYPSSVQSGMNTDDLISRYGSVLSTPAGKEVAEETGEKVATETVEAVAKTTASNVDDIALKATASETIEHGTTQIANEVVENVVGESSESAIKQGLSSKIMTAIVNAVDKLFDNSTVLQHLEKAANIMANAGPAKWIAKLKDRVISIFKKGAPEAVEKAGVSEARQAVSRINILLTVAQLVTDFLIGMDQVEQILGVSKVEGTLGIVEAVVAGIVNALCNLTIIFAIFPGTNWLTRGILELCGDDLAERQAEAEAEYQEHVAKTGSTLTKEEYLKKEKSISGWASVTIKQKAEVAMGNVESKAANSQINKVNNRYAKEHADDIEKYKEKAKEWIAAGVYTEEQLAEDLKQFETPISNERASEIIDQAKAGSLGLMDAVTYGGEWVGDKTGKGIGWLYDKFSGNSKKRKEIENRIANNSSSASKTKVAQASIGNVLSDNNATNQLVTVSNSLAADYSTENKASINAANIVDGIFSTDKVNGTKLKDAGNKMMDIVKSGDLSALTKYKISGGKNSSGITSVVSGSLKTMLSGPTLFTKAFSFIGDELDNVVTAIGETNTEKDEKIIASAENGDISIFSSDYWSQSKEAMADNSLSGIFQKAMSSVTRIAHAPALLFRQLVGVMINSLSNMSEYLSEKMAESGIADINRDGTITASSSGSTTNTSTGISNYIRQDGSIVQSTTIGSTSVNNSTSNSRASKGNNGKKKGVISRIFDKLFGRGTTEAQYGMGYSKQIDPLISSIRYNSYGDSDYQTIGNSGCGPAAAVNAMEAMYGRGSENIVSAARYAIRRGYKEKNGGTTPRFFKDYFSKNGYSSQTTSSKSQLMKNIRSGHPTVLMGKDSGGTSRNTPYGKSPHYVTATGIDRKGHVIIQDPESKYDNQLYSMKDVMRKTSFGVSAFGKSYGTGKGSNQYTYNKYGRGKFGRGSKKIIFVGDSRFVQMYNYRFKGNKDHYVNVTDEDGNVWSAYSGMGLDWMKSTGIPKIESELDKNTALCINMGINGIQDSSVDSTIDAYVSYYNSKIDDWTKKGAEVYFVSVNPVGTSGGSDNYNGVIHNSTVKKFNKGVKAGVSSKMGYIDTYSAIINNYKSSDNLHYDSDTSDAIYNAIVNSVGSGGSDSGDNDSIGVAGKSGGNRRNARVLHIDAEYQDAERSIASSISNYLAENVSYDYSDSSYVGNMSPSSSSKDSSSSSDKNSNKDTSANGTMSITKSKINAATKTKSFNPRKYSKKPKTKKWGKGTERYKPMAKYGTGMYGYGKNRYGRGVTIIEGKTCYDADDPLSILEGQYQQITLNGKKVVVMRPPHNPFEPYSTCYRELQNIITTALSYKTVKARNSSMHKAYEYIVNHKDKILDSYKNTQDYRNFAFHYGLTDYTYHNDKTNDTTDEVVEEDEDTSSSSSSSSSSDSSSSDVAGDTIGSFLSNVLADSKTGQVLNSFISFSNGSSSDEGVENSGSSNSYSGTILDGSDARTKTWNYFTKKGYSKAAVSGIMGNIEKETFQESEPGVFPGDGDAVATTEWKWSGDGTGKSTVAGDPGGGGIIQWTPWNTNTLGPYCKEKTGDETAWMKDLGIQLDCLHEKNMPNIGTGNSYSLPGAGLSSNLVNSREEYMKMDDPEKAARQFQAAIEKPNNAYAHTDRRIAAAKWFYDNMEKIKKSSKSSKSGAGTLFSLPGGFGSFMPGRYGRGVTIIEGKTCYDADDPLSILEGQYQQITLNGKKVVVMRPPHNPFEPYSTCYRELQNIITTALSYKTVKARNSSMHKAYEYIVNHKDKILDSYKNTQDYRNFAFHYGLTDYTYHNDKTNDTTDEVVEEDEDTSSSSSSSSSSDSSSSDVAGDTIGSFLSNVLADSKTGQALNSFISFSNGSSSSSSGSSGSKGSNITGSGTAADMVKIAMKEYEEGNEGDNNKYNTWMWGEGSTLPWCAAFVAWCADQAGVSTDIIPKSGGCIAMAEGILEGGGKQLDDPKDAKPGDIIFYGTRGGYSHVGIVRDYDSKSGFLRTVEGNTGYSKGYGEVGIHDNVGLTGIDIDRPAYNDNSSKKSSKKDKSDSDSSGSGSLFGMGTFGTGDSHEDKPLARYGTFKESIYGTGTNDNTYKAPHTNLQDIKKTIRNGDGSTRKIVYSGMDRELNRIYKSASRPIVHTQTFGLGTSEEVNVQPTAVLNNSRVVDNSALISTIIKILYTIADNTDKLNTIVAILNNKLGANISPEDISNSSNKQTLKSKLHQSLNAAASTATSKLNSYADSVGDASLNTIIQAMNAIAAE